VKSSAIAIPAIVASGLPILMTEPMPQARARASSSSETAKAISGLRAWSIREMTSLLNRGTPALSTTAVPGSAAAQARRSLASTQRRMI